VAENESAAISRALENADLLFEHAERGIDRASELIGDGREILLDALAAESLRTQDLLAGVTAFWVNLFAIPFSCNTLEGNSSKASSATVAGLTFDIKSEAVGPFILEDQSTPNPTARVATASVNITALISDSGPSIPPDHVVVRRREGKIEVMLARLGKLELSPGTYVGTVDGQTIAARCVDDRVWWLSDA
jgi:hypothetical protein